MQPPKLKTGDTIGIISPCHTADLKRYAPYLEGIKRLGYQVKEGINLYKNTYGYAASEQERADDFNHMISDPKVKMILFGGGNVGNEFLPLIDFEAVNENSKIICSYSNGTTILNAVYAQTGLTVYYGQFPGIFADLSSYDFKQFYSNFIGKAQSVFEKNSEWKMINDGVGEGTLIGGYTTRFSSIIGSKYCPFDKNDDYILFLENYEAFNEPSKISAHLAQIEQHELMVHVKGLLFGHYSEKNNQELADVLYRFGRKNGIPVMSCDDFGHGRNHGILPIGVSARLDTSKRTLEFLS